MRSAVSLITIGALASLTLAGCAPAGDEATDRAEVIDAAAPNFSTCETLSEPELEASPLWPVLDYFSQYTRERDSVDVEDTRDAIATLDEFSSGSSGDVQAGFASMRNVLEAIEARYVEDDPLSAIDYNELTDGMNAVFDACEVELDAAADAVESS